MASTNGSELQVASTAEERDYKLTAHAISAIRSIAEAAIQAINEQKQPPATPLSRRFSGKDLTA